MKKKEIIEALELTNEFSFQKQKGSADTHYHVEEIGIFKVYILVSNQVRVIIETSGTKNYFINLKDKSFPFKSIDANTLDEIEMTFNQYKFACKDFTKALYFF